MVTITDPCWFEQYFIDLNWLHVCFGSPGYCLHSMISSPVDDSILLTAVFVSVRHAGCAAGLNYDCRPLYSISTTSTQMQSLHVKSSQTSLDRTYIYCWDKLSHPLSQVHVMWPQHAVKQGVSDPGESEFNRLLWKPLRQTGWGCWHSWVMVHVLKKTWVHYIVFWRF